MRDRRSTAFATLIATVAAAFILVMPATAEATANPTTCEGYAEPRQYVSSQSWWAFPGKPATHAHIELCLPEREDHYVDIPLNIRLVMHNMPSSAKWNYVSVVVKGTDYETTIAKLYQDWSCTGTCERWVSYTIPLSKFLHSGLQEIRLRGFIPQGDGNEIRVNLNWQTRIWNRASDADVTRYPFLRFAKGWYTGFGYCEGSYRSDLAPLSNGPISGLWSAPIRLVDHGSDDANPTHHFVALDSNFHMGDPGTVLRDGAGPFDGTVDVDTTTLSDGRHKLVVQGDCKTSEGTSSGVGFIVFNSENGTTSDPDPACSDGLDNDGDALVDVLDPGCTDSMDTDETDGVAEPQSEPESEPESSAPKAEVTKPSGGQRVSGIFRFDVSVSDPDGIKYVAYLVDGVEVERDRSCCDWSEDWNSKEVANGEHIVVARAKDKLGNVGESAPVSFVVAN